ncbi:biotin synthase BioB [Yunchengibacter salinarum]|uniref:biotin synthase BioB n=1 Tax=Yunchengibacter salinarum TaxID=3133399 RepID=UPI0035B5DF0C
MNAPVTPEPAPRQSSEPTDHPAPVRTDWTRAEILSLFDLPFMDLVHRAQSVHRAFHDPNSVQLSQLMSIKTGGCAEDCAYCPQSAKFAKETGLKATKLMEVERVLEDARRAKAAGASRYCMGAAWTRPKDRDLDAIIHMIKGVKAEGLEACVTLGMLEPHQAERLAEAGLDYYNHNVDTSEDYYEKIISTRSYAERLETLDEVRKNGIHVCSGGIVGMGESREDRAAMLETLATQPEHPGSVPINRLVQVPGTPLYGTEEIDPFEFVRTIAVARILMPKAAVRLSAGREDMSEEMQALCFLAGANSIFYGEKLLTTPNPEGNRDMQLLDRLGMHPA